MLSVNAPDPLTITRFAVPVILLIVAGDVFVITPDMMLIPVPAVNAPCARAVVKYKFVLPSVKSSVVASDVINPLVAFKTPVVKFDTFKPLDALI